jgi:adenylosuccinate synthase
LLKRSAQVNGLSGLCITKLDVLDGLPELQLCTGYRLGSELVDILPMGADDIALLQTGVRNLAGLERHDRGHHRLQPLACRLRGCYLERIEQITGVPIHMVSTSPDRDHTILMRTPNATIFRWPSA